MFIHMSMVEINPQIDILSGMKDLSFRDSFNGKTDKNGKHFFEVTSCIPHTCNSTEVMMSP